MTLIARGPGDMGHDCKPAIRYDVIERAQEIADIDEPIERRREMEMVPSEHKEAVGRMVLMLFRRRMAGV